MRVAPEYGAELLKFRAEYERLGKINPCAIKRCSECAEVFVAEHGNQDFCDKSCAQRSAWQAFKARRKVPSCV